MNSPINSFRKMSPARTRFAVSVLSVFLLSIETELDLIDLPLVDQRIVNFIALTLVVLSATEWVWARVDHTVSNTVVQAVIQVGWAVVVTTIFQRSGTAGGLFVFLTGLAFFLIYVDVIGRGIDPSEEFAWDLYSLKMLHYLLAVLFLFITTLAAFVRGVRFV
ncbi:MAG: hypothetical protein V5A31_06375 [Haloferacaceae archaeon]